MNSACARGLRRAGLLGLLLGSGCAVGPDYRAPLPPRTPGYTAQAARLPTPGAADPAQRLLPGAALPARWWSGFGSPALDATVRLALAESPTLQQARAALRQARAAVGVARGGLAPQVDAQAGASRGVAGPQAPATELYVAGPLVSYLPDAFGATRRLVEQQTAIAAAQSHQLDAARLALSGQVVGQIVAAASAREQLLALDEVLQADRRSLELVGLALRAGRASRADLLGARSQLAADRTLRPPLLQQLALAQHALARLVGRSAGSWQPPALDLAQLQLPRGLPLVVPSLLARRRPDIAAAEALLHAASAAIGVATADIYPRISLSAQWSAMAGGLGSLFGGGAGWGLSAGLSAPIWHGGALRAQREAAREAYRAQFAVYRETVLLAFNQVADVLQALVHDAQAVRVQNAALRSAAQSLVLQREAYAAGAGDLLQVLAAQRLFAQARLGYARARAQRFADTAQWFTVMGAVPAP